MFSVVVPTFQRPDVLGTTLQALLATDYPPEKFELIIVDDASDPGTQAVIDAVSPRPVRLTLLQGDGRGAAAARNLGAAAASGDYLVFVDDDIVVPPNHLRAQLETRALHGECISGADWWEFTPQVRADLCASRVGRFRLALEDSYRKRGRERWAVQNGLAAAHLTIRRDVFIQLRGFDERFPRAGVEDWEFCLRARDHGWNLILDNSLLLLHNDRRLTLEQLCRREEWRGLSVGVLATIRPDMYRESDVVRQNSVIQLDDVLWLRTRKAVKQALGTPVALSLLHRGTGQLERVLSYNRVLHRLYKAIISVHYLRGFREGVALAHGGRGAPTGADRGGDPLRPTAT